MQHEDEAHVPGATNVSSMNRVIECDAEEFLDLCWNTDDDGAVRKALDTQPELVRCRDTRPNKVMYTPLHHASNKGHEEVVRVLLEHDAAVDAQDTYGWTALHCATRNAQEMVARVLLEGGAEVDAEDAHGVTALRIAAQRGYEAMVQVLLEHGADCGGESTGRWNALHDACYSGWDDVVRVLLGHGAELHARDEFGSTPLHGACRGGHVGVVRLLLEHGADRRVRDDRGKDAAAEAARRGKREVVTVLEEYFPITPSMGQVLLGLRGASESALARFARHALFEPKVLSLVKCLLSGEGSAAFEQLQEEVQR